MILPNDNLLLISSCILALFILPSVNSASTTRHNIQRIYDATNSVKNGVVERFRRNNGE